MVSAYFYTGDRQPLPAREQQGNFAAPSGQLFCNFTFDIDADDKPIDAMLELPLDQFTILTNLQFRCIVYADNQSECQTELLSLVTDSSSTPLSGIQPKGAPGNQDGNQ